MVGPAPSSSARSASYTYNGNYGYERGSGLLDQRHRFIYSFVWAPPAVHSNNAFLKYFVDGWQLSGIVTLATGHPTGSPTIRIVSAPTLASGSILSTSTITGYQGGSTRVPFLPVNDLYTPAIYRADIRVTKAIPLGTERVKLLLIGEAFNISNTWSPTALFTQEYTATKGDSPGDAQRDRLWQRGRRLPRRYAGPPPSGQCAAFVLTSILHPSSAQSAAKSRGRAAPTCMARNP